MYCTMSFSRLNQCTIALPLRSGVVRVHPRSSAQQCKATIAAAPPAFMLEGALTQQHSPHQAEVFPQAASAAQNPVAQFPAVLSAAARTAEQVAAEVEQQLQLFPQALVQAVEPEMYASLRKLLNGVQYHARAKMLLIKPKQEDGPSPAPAKQRRLPGMLCVVGAGPEDQAVADQVKLVAEHLGCFVTCKTSLSTRDLQGLMNNLPALQAADAVVVVAGVDGSLPGAIAGLVDAPVIAVPTSQGSSGGLAGLGGLVAAVNSCNMGVSAVGIDQSAAAATMAARMLRMAATRVEKLAAQQAAAPPPARAVPQAPSNGNGATAVNNVVPTMLDGLSLTPALSAVTH